jgi:molybdate transport system substrate-binding protein
MERMIRVIRVIRGYFNKYNRARGFVMKTFDRHLGFGLFILLSFMAGCSGPKPESISVFAAASTREVMEQLAADFQNETGIAVILNFGPSSGLARQIEQGANADLFLSADESWADYLVEKGLVAERRDLLTNKLVVIVPSSPSPLGGEGSGVRGQITIQTLADLTKPEIHRLALAGKAVPAGMYARKALQSAGLWDQLKDRVVEGSDVRAALAYVTRGEAEAGMVYATDAAGNSKVRIALEVNPKLHDPIRYPLALIKQEPAHPAARPFYDYLSSAHAIEIFSQAGFGMAP